MSRWRELVDDEVWQMSLGERMAIEGILSSLRPGLAVEIGTAEGASLRRIAHHAAEVHSFDLLEPSLPDLGDHVHLHTGDSAVTLPRALQAFADAGRNVNFALVDGEHSAAGVRRDVEALLASPAVADTVIVAHDTANEEVRRGLDAIPFAAWPKVVDVDLDFVPGHLGRDRFSGELWYGLGLIVVRADQPRYGGRLAHQTDRHPAAALLALARDQMAGSVGAGEGAPGDSTLLRQEVEALRADVAHHRSVVAAITSSASWRAGAPLRVAKRAADLVRPRRTPSD